MIVNKKTQKGNMKLIAQTAAALAAITITLALALLPQGCATEKQVVASTNTTTAITTNTSGQVIDTTNTLVTQVTNTVVNPAVLALDCAAIQTGAGVAVNFAVAKDPNARVVLGNVETALSGVLNGATTNSIAQVGTILGTTGNQAVTSSLSPLINSLSTYEQGLLAKYGQSVGGQIVLAITKAIYNGIQQGL
jgi:hypothetical protein